jgi:hypothetical protein
MEGFRMALSAEQRRIRARLAINSRYRPDDPRTEQLRRELVDSRREQRICELLSMVPRLPVDRLARISALVASTLVTSEQGP